jgi:hypothetical protein
MQSIKYNIEKLPNFETVEDKRFTNETAPQEFAALFSIFSDRQPHLLNLETVDPANLSSAQGRLNPFKLSRACFSVDVCQDGTIRVYCQYETVHPDGKRLHTYLLTNYN